MPRIGFILGVDASPILGEFHSLVASFMLIAPGQEFPTKEHPVVAQGVADDVALVRQAEHQGDGAIPMLTHDLAATGKHRAAIPAGQADAPVLVLGVTRYVVRVHRRAEGGESVTVTVDDSDFQLPTPLTS